MSFGYIVRTGRSRQTKVLLHPAIGLQVHNYNEYSHCVLNRLCGCCLLIVAMCVIFEDCVSECCVSSNDSTKWEI